MGTGLRHYIYLIENAASRKFYIGRTNYPDQRRRWHFSHLRRGTHTNPKLQLAFNKYGEGSFFFNVVDYASDSAIQAKEAEWFAMFNHDKRFLYNCHFKTDGSGGMHRPHTVETKLKMSKVQKDATRKYIFDIITERYETKVGLRELAKKHKVSTTTIFAYVPEWESMTGLTMFESPQVEATKQRVAKFVDEYKRIGREANRNFSRFGLSQQALKKHLPSFGLSFDDVRLDGWMEEGRQRALDAIAHYKKHGGKVCDVLAKFNTNTATFYKYLKA